MNLDEQLLNKGGAANDSSAKAGELRAAQRGSSDGLGDAGKSGDGPQTLREAVLAAKRQQADKEKKGDGLADKAAGAVAAPIKQGTSNLLKQAWLHLIDSFGFTLIWIDIHVFLRQIFEKFFCKLGEEWLPTYGVGGEAGGEPSLADSSAGKQASKSIGLVETMGFFTLNIGCLFLIIAVFTVAGMILDIVANPLKAIAELFGALWGAITGD